MRVKSLCFYAIIYHIKAKCMYNEKKRRSQETSSSDHSTVAIFFRFLQRGFFFVCYLYFGNFFCFFFYFYFLLFWDYDFHIFFFWCCLIYIFVGELRTFIVIWQPKWLRLANNSLVEDCFKNKMLIYFIPVSF